jgi:hypothetical protein
MSQEALQNLMDRIYKDTAFRDQVITDPVAALAGCDLSATELVALGTNDADGLRRLCGDEVAGYGITGSPLCGTGGAGFRDFSWGITSTLTQTTERSDRARVGYNVHNRPMISQQGRVTAPGGDG